MLHHLGLELNFLYFSAASYIGLYDIVSRSSTSCDHLVLIGRNGSMTVNATSGLDSHFKIRIVFQSKIMDEPYTKSQQERKQKNCKISPADIQDSKKPVT